MQANLSLRLSQKRDLTADICEFTFVAADGAPLPRFEAGAHLTIETPSGAWRSYSLNNDDGETSRYVIAVKREEQGRGGSLSLHRQLHVDQLVHARAPHNGFALVSAPRYLLIAGGIGITPMLSMLRRLRRQGCDVHMVYLTRSRDMAAYADLLESPEFSGLVTLHHDHGDPKRTYDFWPLFATPDDRHIYFCGPPALMNAIYLRTIHWPRRQIHSESFSGVDAQDGQASAFRLRRASTGETFDIAADKSILDVLRDRRIAFASSCESGTCGTCKVPLVAGEPDHRDLCLSEEERQSAFIPCVSRALSDEITLDI
ncbi:PDR/VanB family oxidoreductase [Rhizobium sp. FY34]|uniref:PDR/VanB family oxidoreductase n=1 Tax=Rhizobium sp. FY34 TaxID=2562309 RepID=UPI0010C0D508|nr:PDR/VanB family oxidoreductase [Rhizobium sp. FY34]